MKETASYRVASVDWLRGVIMALMLLDHMREFLHGETFWHDPAVLAEVGSFPFIMRWLTNFCAPMFVVLAGISIALQLKRGKTLQTVSRFLWTRGLWLLLCELTLVPLGAEFYLNPMKQVVGLQILWVFGWCMLLMPLILRLPLRWVLWLSILCLVSHNLLDPITTGPQGWGAVWHMLHQEGKFQPFGLLVPRLRIVYPLIPWPALMALGYWLGMAYGLGDRKLYWRIGLGCLLAFVCIRLLNGYGEPMPWSVQGTALRTLLSFVQVSKYPPSLLFVLSSLGIGLSLLAWREQRACPPGGAHLGAPDQKTPEAAQPFAPVTLPTKRGLLCGWGCSLDKLLVTLGSVPFFFYLLQWFVVHGMTVLFHWLAGKTWSYTLFFQGPAPPDYGFRYWAVFLGWGLGMMVLYPVCRWFSRFKASHRAWRWLSYL